MTQEEKDLLLKDLCGRLPYGVKVQVYNHWRSEYETETLTLKNYHDLIDTFCVEDIKPYLFPLSSMSAEQRKEYTHLLAYTSNVDIIQITGESTYDWLNRNMFDWRGLIPMGSAIDATGLKIY